MRIIFKPLRYLVALALFAGGACVIGGHVAASLESAAGKAAAEAAEGEAEVAGRGLVELLKLSVADAPGSPAWHLAVGAGLAALGLLIARPAITITFGAKAKPEKKTARDPIQDLSNADPGVRLRAATTLTSAAKPSTIPALIGALRDRTSKVRGQACEALANMTGSTFDFVDVAPRSAREESVGRWEAWWAENEAAVLAGADPRIAGGEAASPPEEPLPGAEEIELPEPEPAPSEAAAPAAAVTAPKPGSTAAITRKTPVPPSVRTVAGPKPAAESTSGRNLTVKEFSRRRRERARASARNGTGELRSVHAREPAAPEAAPPAAPEAAPEEPPADSASPPSGGPAAEGGRSDKDTFEVELPPPDQNLPSSEEDLPSPDEELPPPPP